MSTLARIPQACALLRMFVCQIKNQKPPNPDWSPTDPWLPVCEGEKTGDAEGAAEYVGFHPNMVGFGSVLTLICLNPALKIWKLLLSFIHFISFLSPLCMDGHWITTQQRSGPSRYTIWSWVYVCAGSLETASDTASCIVTVANRTGPIKETRNCACTGTS